MTLESNNFEKGNEEKNISNEEGRVKTTLIFHPDWELSSSERYIYMFQHQQLTLLKPNQVSIDGIKLLNYNDGFVVVAFLRNTLDKPIHFESINLILLNGEGQALAKRRFDLDTLGEIPAHSCIPWRFLFEESDKLGETIPETGWRIEFELVQSREDKPHELDLAPSWEDQLGPEQKENLRKIVADLPKLEPNQVNIMGFKAEFSPEGQLGVTVMIRNGSENAIQLEQIPLAIVDATGDIIAKGGFKLNDFKVKSNATRPWTFVFPKELLTKENPDMSSWKVIMPTQNQ
ncbi:accessory Sec system S-layer assembly protein [Bacillus sp. FJAT-27245]|uniref:accessory Sec system S-layer assembly protein n=1 Tax=Bacillus sp. FJAT-27245 TaxID=1684144 RepID=UPI000B10DFE8|nr:accessory Sec system S-layer assembly protein [Bacillus sp. FJAT-27245]